MPSDLGRGGSAAGPAEKGVAMLDFLREIDRLGVDLGGRSSEDGGIAEHTNQRACVGWGGDGVGKGGPVRP